MNTKAKLLAASFVLLAFMSVSVMAQKTVALAPFNSVELRNGGRVFLSHGATQQVTLLKGSQQCTQFTVVDGRRLVIDDNHQADCTDYELQVEIVIPDIKGIAVAHGGLIQSRGVFPNLSAISVAVNNGGNIDIRSMTVDSVTAAVNQGGRIFVRPRTALVASVANGGIVTYWGNPKVTSAIKGGGVVTKGTAAEANEPVQDTHPSFPVLPALPRVPRAESIQLVAD
jgi:hypothetical protein